MKATAVGVVLTLLLGVLGGAALVDGHILPGIVVLVCAGVVLGLTSE